MAKTQTLDSVMTAMATWVAPGLSIDPTIKFSGLGSVCHVRVAKGIQARQKLTDMIWVYGYDPRNVMHSVLTDLTKRIVVDSLGSSGEFYREGGYKWIEGTLVPMIKCLTVRQWRDLYMRGANETPELARPRKKS